MTYRLLLSPQGEEGGGTSTPPAGDASDAFQRLLKKHNDDGTRLAEKLFGENYELRQKNSTLSARVPGEGAVVLQGDDAKDWQRYREFGKPSEVKASLESGRAAVAERDRLGKAESYRRVADHMGYTAPVFSRLAAQDDLAIEVVDGKEKGTDGKPVKVAVVKGDGDSATPLEQYVADHWAEFLPALGGKAARDPRGHSTPPPRPISAFPRDGTDDPIESVKQGLAATNRYAW